MGSKSFCLTKWFVIIKMNVVHFKDGEKVEQKLINLGPAGVIALV